MARSATYRELAALAPLMRQLEAIKEQFQAERLRQQRDAAELEAQRIGRDPFVLDTGYAAGHSAVPLVRRRFR